MSPPEDAQYRLAFMYRCALCRCVVPPRTPAQSVVLASRPRKYPPRTRANEVVRKHKVYCTDDPGGLGRETVREVLVCPGCALSARSVGTTAGG